MKRKGFIWVMVLLTVVASVGFGCSGENESGGDVDIFEIPEDYVYLASENVYIQDAVGTVYIPLISGKPINEENFKVIVNGKTLVGDENSEDREYILGGYWSTEAGTRYELPLFLYQTYRGKDWKADAEIQLAYKQAYNGKTREDLASLGGLMSQIEESQAEFYDDYISLQEQGRLPALYSYLLQLWLPDKVEEWSGSISEITLIVDDREYVFPVGELNNKNLLNPYTDLERLLERESGNAGWNLVYPSEKGDFRGSMGKDDCAVSAIENVTITDLRLFEDDREISDIQVVIINPLIGGEWIGGYYDEEGNELALDIVSDFIWDGKTPIELSKGQLAYFSFIFHEPRLAGKFYGFTEYYFTVEYQDENGENSNRTPFWFPLLIDPVSCNPFECYLQHELGVDVMSYYTDFYDVLEESGGVVGIMDMPEE
ncbi:MAG: hypothetical protein Q4C04_08275 [Clostridia bacterium]|nr:hypothetical protein [Clostridia bacterium]